MNYYIDPRIIYWIHVISTFEFIISIVAMASGIVFGILLFFYISQVYDTDMTLDESAKWTKKMMIRTFAIFIVSLVGFIFVPDKDTMKEMLIASYVTEENVKSAKGEIKELIDYIFNKVEKYEEPQESEDRE